jgi:nucleoid-associated protein YgaU
VGNPGSIEKIMVTGILVIILGILAVAIFGQNAPNAAQEESRLGELGAASAKLAPPPVNPRPPEGAERRPESPGGDGALIVQQGDLAPATPIEETEYDNATRSRPAIETPPAQPVTPVTPVTPPRVEPEVAKPTSYTVKSGDSLAKIARTLYGDEGMVDAIVKANPGLDKDKIFVGQALKLPATGAAAPGVPNAPAADPAPPATPPTAKKRTYTIKSGDNLIKISKQFYGNVSMVKKIYEKNRKVQKSMDHCPAGVTIELP